MNGLLVLLPAMYAEAIDSSGLSFGTLDVKYDLPEQVAVVDGYRVGTTGTRRAGMSNVPRAHYLQFAATRAGSGLWFRVRPELHLEALSASVRSSSISLDGFNRCLVDGNPIRVASGQTTVAITITDPTDWGEPRVLAWQLEPDNNAAHPLALELVPEEPDLLQPLAGVWPIEDLAAKPVALIGAGSIGSAAAEAMTAYGVRQLILVDPDRLRSHNFARHRVHPSQVGRLKVTALAARLTDRDPRVTVELMAKNVVHDADFIRPMLREVDIVLVSSDGVDSRRAANHLACRAHKPAVFACVLGDGAFGEILRSRPPLTGCLLCARAQLVANGGMSPEPSLDRGYGGFSRHLPMSAVGGDLGLVGQFAAKCVVATLLENLGYREQTLPGEHAVLGLQPKPNMAPPFDIEHCGEVRWTPGAPRRTDCPSCGEQ